MITTHRGTVDFPVQNILCSECNQMCFFSHQQSTPDKAIFYCNNEQCKLDGVFVYPDETSRLVTQIWLDK